MKFPRHAKILRSPFEVAPFAAVFFLLMIFLLLAALLPAPGIPLQLPVADASPGRDLPGTDRPIVAVAVDAAGRLYFANQMVPEAELKARLAGAATHSAAPLTLLIQADQSVPYSQLVRLALLARDAGIRNALLATLPRVITAPNSP